MTRQQNTPLEPGHFANEDYGRIDESDYNDFTFVNQFCQTDPPPVTAKQFAFLSRLTTRLGQQKVESAKERLGLADVALLDLTRRQAARLIKSLAKGGRRR